MHIDIPLPDGLSLRMSGAPAPEGSFATSSLQRGLLLLDGEQELAEEAVGFGVPIVKRGLQTIFPGSAAIEVGMQGSIWLVRARFQLNRVERLVRRGAVPIDSPLFNSTKNLFEVAMRRVRASRAILTGMSSMLRKVFHWETTYVDALVNIEMRVVYRVEAQSGRITVELDGRDLREDLTEVVLMHEQGAHAFDRYRDSAAGILVGPEIGIWEEVRAPQAWLESSTRGIRFAVSTVPGARLFRGRELVGTRLAWAGFGYSLPPDFGTLNHELVIARQA